MLRVILIFLCFYCSLQSVFAQYEISGTLKNYDSIWKNKIHLSLIDPYEKFNHIHLGQIISTTTIDKEGNFIFKGNILPESNSIIRLHLTDTEDTHTVFFSIKPKNYLLLIANNNSKIHITAPDFSLNPSDYEVSGDLNKINNEIKELESSLSIDRFNYSKPDLMKNSSLINEKRTDIAREFCISNNSPLLNILALQNIHDLEKDYLKNSSFYETLISEKFKNNNNPYIEAFKKQIGMIKYKNDLLNDDKSSARVYIVVLILILPIAFFTWFVIRRKKGRKNSIHLNQLTKREKEILKLINKGYQNKEIASELHIEVSTIKTHISNIYKKLEVKNRSEITQLISTSTNLNEY